MEKKQSCKGQKSQERVNDYQSSVGAENFDVKSVSLNIKYLIANEADPTSRITFQ